MCDDIADQNVNYGANFNKLRPRKVFFHAAYEATKLNSNAQKTVVTNIRLYRCRFWYFEALALK